MKIRENLKPRLLLLKSSNSLVVNKRSGGIQIRGFSGGGSMCEFTGGGNLLLGLLEISTAFLVIGDEMFM